MSRKRVERFSRTARPAPRRLVSAMELLEALLSRERQADANAEDEKLTRARVALFGCAPK